MLQVGINGCIKMLNKLVGSILQKPLRHDLDHQCMKIIRSCYLSFINTTQVLTIKSTLKICVIGFVVLVRPVKFN